MCVSLVVLTFVPAGAQRPSVWHLTAPTASYGPDHGLYQVTSAVVLPGGGIAVADAGNGRVVILPGGSARHVTVGRKGFGPGEFQWISALFARADTIYVYDGVLLRVAAFTDDGEHVRTLSLPRHATSPTELVGLLESGQWLLKTREATVGRRAGLVEDSSSFLLFDPASGAIEEIGRMATARRYFFPQAGGFTTYDVPFHGRGHVAATQDALVIIALDSTVLYVQTADGGSRAVPLPLVRRPFDPRVVELHVDSLLSEIRRCGQCSSQMARRVRDAFSTMPLPRFAPLIRRVLEVDGQVWIESYDGGDESASAWLIVDPEEAAVAAMLRVPEDLVVLGGGGGRVILLAKDDLEVEHVQIRAIRY